MKTKTILVTGATSGIGRHAALHLARAGHRVFATGRRAEALASLQEEAGELALETFALDVNQPASIEAAVAEVEKRTDGYGLDVLVNNAGYGKFGPLALVPDSELRGQFETNVFGLLKMCQAFIPKMRERGSGRIINVGSVLGRMTLILQGVYGATKYAVEALSDNLRREVACLGIHVSIVEPGMIRTNFEGTAGQDIGVYLEDPIYGPAVRTYAEEGEKMYKNAPGPESVSRAIAHAVHARRPRTRYIAPFYNTFMLFLMNLLPTRVADWIFKKMTGLRQSSA